MGKQREASPLLCPRAHASRRLLQILVPALNRAEMDGAKFQDTPVVPVIEQTDRALHRPGRFRFQIVAENPLRTGGEPLRPFGAAVVAGDAHHKYSPRGLSHWMRSAARREGQSSHS